MALLVKELVPTAHASSHEDAGSDQLTVTDLLGLLATAQTPVDHNTSHEDAGDDEVSIAGLGGESAELAAHKVLDTGVHGSGGSYLAYFGQQGIDVSRIIWKDTFTKILDLDTSTPAIAWTDIDVTGSTSAFATMVILHFRFKVGEDGSSGSSVLQVRKNGVASILTIAQVIAGSENNLVKRGMCILGLDEDEVMEYQIVAATGSGLFAIDLDVIGYIE